MLLVVVSIDTGTNGVKLAEEELETTSQEVVEGKEKKKSRVRR